MQKTFPSLVENIDNIELIDEKENGDNKLMVYGFGVGGPNVKEKATDLIKQDVWLSKSAWQTEHLKIELPFSYILNWIVSARFMISMLRIMSKPQTISVPRPPSHLKIMLVRHA